MSIWLELRVTQGHPFHPADEHDVSGMIEDVLNVPQRQVFFDSEGNISWTFVRFDEARIPVNRLLFYQDELKREFRRIAGKAIDEVNVVDTHEVAEHIPEAT